MEVVSHRYDLDSLPSLSLADTILDGALTPLTAADLRRARLTCARHATDPDDLRDLLDALGLGEDAR